VTDETDAETEVSVYYRNGVLFVPSSAASHFGLSVSLLYSHGGYPVLRFKTGGQVYGDDEFLERADSVITYRAESTDAPEPEPSSPEMPPLHQPQEEEPPQTPLRYYPVLWSEAVSETNLKLLNNHEIRAAFFLTEEQIQNNRSLVRAICSAGHTVGVTVTAEETQVEEALARANDALDQVVFSKSMMALLHAGQTLMEDIYLTVSSDYVAAEGSTELLLVLTSADETARLQQLQTEEATFLHLRENTVIP